MLPFASLTTLVLAAMVSFVPLRSHASFEPPAVTESRYASIAGDIATAAEEAPAPGLSAPETAVVLASVAAYESQYSRAVDACQRRGGTKASPSWSLWQVAGERSALCTSRLSAARIALGLISQSITRCRRAGVDALSWYSVGRCTQDLPARWRWQRARGWLRLNPFEAEAPS